MLAIIYVQLTNGLNFAQILCAAAIIGGSITLFAGAKLIKFTVFLASFAVTGWIGYTMWRNICTYLHVAPKVWMLKFKHRHSHGSSTTIIITSMPHIVSFTHAHAWHFYVMCCWIRRSKQKECSLVSKCNARLYIIFRLNCVCGRNKGISVAVSLKKMRLHLFLHIC